MKTSHNVWSLILFCPTLMQQFDQSANQAINQPFFGSLHVIDSWFIWFIQSSAKTFSRVPPQPQVFSDGASPDGYVK